MVEYEMKSWKLQFASLPQLRQQAIFFGKILAFSFGKNGEQIKIFYHQERDQNRRKHKKKDEK